MNKKYMPYRNTPHREHPGEGERADLVTQFIDYYDRVRHAPHSGARVGFHEMSQLPDEILTFFEEADDADKELIEKYLFHTLSDEEKQRLVALYSDYVVQRYH